MMARPREFEIDKAVEAAMNQFWERGYDSTSLRHLMEATGLHKGSLYKAFDDKKSLFIAALEQYEAMGRQRAEQAFSEAPTALEGLRGMLRSAVAPDVGCGESKRGCLIINTIVERPSLPPEIQQAISGVCERFANRVASVMAAGQAQGAIRTDRPPIVLAKQFLYSGLSSVEVAWKNDEAPEILELLIDQAIDGLRP